jgi:hypothetical protein
MRRAASAKRFLRNIVFPATTAPRASGIIGLRVFGRPRQCANYVHLNHLTQPRRLEHRRSCRRRPDRVQFHLWSVHRWLCRRRRQRHLLGRRGSRGNCSGACPHAHISPKRLRTAASTTRQLPLGELEAFPRAGLSRFFPFFHARIPTKQSVRFQR